MNERPQILLLLLSAGGGLAMSFAPGLTLLGAAAALFFLRERVASTCYLYFGSLLDTLGEEQAEPRSGWRPGINACRVFVLGAAACFLALGLASVL